MVPSSFVRASRLIIIRRRAPIAAVLFSFQLATATSAATTNTWIGNTGPEWGTNGNWTTANVSGIPATGDTLVFDGTGNSGVPSDNNLGSIASPLSIATLNFVNGANAYTLTSDSGVNDVPLAVTTSLINQASGQTQTINFAINPTAPAGTLFMGSTTVATPDTNGNATLMLNANAQFTALSSSINNGSADTLQIGNSNTLTLNGSITVGGYNISAGTGKLIVNGGSLIDTPGGTAVFAVGDSPGASQATGTTTVLDMSGLNTFRFTGQQVDVGGNQGANTGNRAIATLTLAAGTNTIVASSATNGITVGGGSTSNGGTSILHLNGTAVNTLDTAILQIGTLKSTGTVDFSAGSGGTFVFRNAAGTGRAPIFVGLHNGAGTAAAKGTLNLVGHAVDIMATTITVGSISAVTTGNATLVSTASFDTGTVDTTSILLGNRVASALGTPQATLNMGGGNLIVNSSTGPGGGTFVLGNNASTATGNTTGTFNLSGGTATINTNITMGATGSGTTGVINLTGGTLSMGNGVAATNFAIGTSAAPITTFTMPTSGQTATIQNLGGTGIFASGGSGASAGGLSMNDSGILNLGSLTTGNTYSGTTTFSGGGTLQLNNASSVGTSVLNYTNGTLAFGPGVGTFQLGGLSGTGNINLIDTASATVSLKITSAGGSYSGQLSGAGGLTVQGVNGTTVQTFTANQAYSGNTTITGGTLQLQNAQLYAAPATPGTTTINGGTLAGSGHVRGAVTLSSGSIVPDAGGTTLELNSLITNGGGFTFSLNGGTVSNITVDGSAALNLGTISFTGSIPTPGTYTLLTAGALTHSGFTLSDGMIGAATIHPFFSGNLLEVTVTGQPSNLIWVGANGSGAWDVATTKNWNNQTTSTNPDFFHNLDSVQFDDSSTHNTVNITGPVQPTAVVFNNTSAHNYVINSSNSNGIGGSATLTMNSSNGTGTATLNTVNAYTGNTTVQSGTLIVGSTGSIASPNTNITGGALNVSGSLLSTNINVSGSGALSVAAGGSLTGPGATVTVGNSSGTGFSVANGGSVPATLNLVNNGTTTFNSSQTIATLNGSSGATLSQSTGTLTVSGGGTYAGAINGLSGGLTVAGGTLLLTGANNYGGATTINSGATLQVDDGIVNAGSLSSNSSIANNGTLIFARTDSPAAIANTISGTGLIEANSSSGTITLSGNNSAFTGSTGVYSGTLQQGSPNALGAATVALFIGQPTGPAGGTTPGNLILGSDAQVGSFSALSANTSTTPTSTVTIPAGNTLTVNGAFLIGAVNATGNTFDNTTNLTGGGSLVVSGTGNFIVGQPSNNAAGAKDTTNSDMSQLNSINVNTTGIFAVGYGSNSRGSLSLADNSSTSTPSNFINASEIDVGNSLSDNNVGQSVLTLGQGTNVLEANTINIGLGKTGGSVTWAGDASTSSSVSITGTGGGSALANIVVSGQNSATSGGVASNLLLAGHVAHVQASSLLIGGNIGNITAGAANGTVTFDTGTFDVGSVSIGAFTSGGSTAGPTGTLTIGGSSANNTATGVFNIHGPVTLGNVAVNLAVTATANLNINSGVVNIGGNISVPSLFGTTNSTLSLDGNGVLNMAGHSIGGNGAVNSGNGPVSNFQINPSGSNDITNSPTLMNLGGTGVFATGGNSPSNGGLTMGSAGTLILDGLNTYTGGTTINSGTLQVGQASSASLASPLGDVSGTVTVGSGTLAFGSNGTAVVANPITGGGSSIINQIGNGKTLITGTGSFTGQTNVNAGTLSIQGTLNNTGSPGTISVGGGNLAGSGITGADVTLNSGSITPDATGSALRVNSLTTNGGTLQFNIDGATIGKITSSNFVNLSAGQLNFGLLSAPTPGNYTIISANSAPTVAGGVLSIVHAGRTTFTPSQSGNNIVVNVAGGPATLTWNNSAGGNGTDWDVTAIGGPTGQQNWTSSAGTDPNRYYQFDNVNFTDAKGGSSSTVNLNTTVTPLSITVNTANGYTFQGSGSISGTGGLTLMGGGSLNLANTGGNTYTGATNITNGTLKIGAAGALPNGTSVSMGATGKLDLGGNSATLGSLSGSGTIANSSTASNSSLIYAGLGNSTFSGSINDTLPGGNKNTSLTLGSGSLTLTGTNAYTGNTVINSGASLQVGAGGASGSLSTSTAITDNGSLTFNTTTSPVIANNISGIGQLVQSGSATLTLIGANTYGGTVINSGTVQIGNGAAAGSLGEGPVTDNGSLKFNLTSNLTYGNTISGTGTVVQAGTGTVSLTTNNNYNGGTTVSSGTLQVSGSGGLSALGTGNVTVSGGATLVGANADAFGFTAGAGTSPLNVTINGGTVTDLPTASYRVTLPNLSFTGGTLTSAVGNNGDAQGQYSLQGTVLNGTFNLTTNAASTTAAITAPVVTLGSNATFNVAAGTVTGGSTPGVDLLISSSIRNYTGAGGTVVPVTKTGAGVMKLTGVNTYTGATTVANGKLVLGVANSINTTVSVTLGDAVNSTSGTLATGGFVQTLAGTFGLATSGHIDLGLGGQPGGGAVHFGASNGLWGASTTLTIDNWTPGIDHLFFGSSNTGIDPAQVSDITFANFGAAQITATGEIIPVAAVPTFVLGDVNGDGHFNVADISAEMAALTNIATYKGNYGPNHLVLNTDELDAVLDQNHDGVINNLDVQAAISSLANTGGAGTVTAVPEPASFVLLAVGGILVLVGARARKHFSIAK